ncbi:hypothetical protein SDC9_67695 [bioreactor metagenome]|uniref:WYL domain-containing protein n=2 Tax=root TaxID=1 RepID=A0A644Y018_9ZZZZ
MLGTDVVVLSPPALRAELVDHLTALVEGGDGHDDRR